MKNMVVYLVDKNAKKTLRRCLETSLNKLALPNKDRGNQTIQRRSITNLFIDPARETVRRGSILINR